MSWKNCHEHGVDFREEDGCPVCALVVERNALRARVANLEAKQKWYLAHSVFPDANFDVLVCWDTTNDYPVIGMLDGGEEGQWVDHNGDPFPVPPSHWMPLPDSINP